MEGCSGGLQRRGVEEGCCGGVVDDGCSVVDDGCSGELNLFVGF